MEERPHLYIIPIVHTYADMGDLRDKIPFDEEYDVAVTRYWVGIFRYLRGLPSDFLASLRIYQDGLINAPTGNINQTVEETRTANYEILHWLKEQGAQILGTEDQGLLIEDYRSLQAIANCTDGEVKTTARLEYLKKSSLLLKERDKSIAQRIRETLPAGKTGLLFIGVAHDVGSLLSSEMRVSTPEMVSRPLSEVLRAFYGLGQERK